MVPTFQLREYFDLIVRDTIEASVGVGYSGTQHDARLSNKITFPAAYKCRACGFICRVAFVPDRRV
jgi:hypothetical protein